MQQFQSQFLQQLNERGFINQITHPQELDALLKNQKISAYIGFDCTAKSLHIGSLIQIMILQILQQCGHQPIILLGGGTTKIGDPSGKDESRQFLDETKIAENLKGIETTLKKFDLSHQNPAFPAFKFVNNDNWLKDLSYLDFLRDVGKHFSVNKMLTFDSVKLRLERQQPLSFLEFNYMILQAYDFYELNKNHGCTLQIGGSDQWGNIVSGVDLTRRITALDKKTSEVFGLTTPLLTTSDGKKMGKTADGAVWLSEQMLSPFDYFQYFRNVDDADVSKLLKFFTHLSLAEIAAVEKEEINRQKEILAFQTTKLCHGEASANQALSQAQAIFGNEVDIHSLPEKPIKFSQEEMQNGKKLVEILRETSLCESGGEAKRLIKGGGVKIDDVKIEDENLVIWFKADQPFFKISLGKKKFFKISIIKLPETKNLLDYAGFSTKWGGTICAVKNKENIPSPKDLSISPTILPNRAVIAISGADRKSFLQGLITNDIEKATASQAIYALMLSPVGRFLYDFFILADGEILLLDCDKNKVEEIIQKLSFYKLRSKVEIKKETDLLVAVAFDAADFVDKKLVFADPRTDQIGYRGFIYKTYETFLPNQAAINEYNFRRLNLKLSDDSDLSFDKSFPLEFGFDNFGAIDYKKGCYIGQETIARTHYKSIVRKKIFLVEIENFQQINHGCEIEMSDKKIGEILSSVFYQERLLALALIKNIDNDDKKISLEQLQLITKNGERKALKIIK